MFLTYFAYLNLPVHMGVVWYGNVMMYYVLFKQCTKVCIIEIWASVADDEPLISVLGEDVTCSKSEHLSMDVCLSGDSLDQLGHIIHRYQDVIFPIYFDRNFQKVIDLESQYLGLCDVAQNEDQGFIFYKAEKAHFRGLFQGYWAMENL